MKRWEISALQASLLVIGMVSMSGHALTTTQFLRAGGRDTWMVALIALPAGILAAWAFARLRLMFPNDTLVQYLPKVLGYAGYVIAALYILYFFTVLVFTLRMTTDWMVDSILTETPSWVMGVLYMAAVAYTALGGLDVVARTNQFTLALLIGFGFLVSFSTMQAKDYRLLMPFFENGYGPVLSAAFLCLGYYGEVSVVGVFDAYVKQKEQRLLFRWYLVALFFAAGVFTGPVAGSMATLGYRVAQNMPYPTFQHWLMVSYPRFFERIDLLAVHQWLAGAYVRCAVYLLLSSRGLCQLVTVKRVPEKWVLGALAVLSVAVSQLAWDSKPSFDRFIMDVYLPTGAYLGTLLPPVIWLVALVRGFGKVTQGKQTYGG
ncbi:MAG TPA: endospore germination permease [Symbiobacteriaceae bacterium]|nr:endospore germination permease [Symbiobacteriaceae bacterium]